MTSISSASLGASLWVRSFIVCAALTSCLSVIVHAQIIFPPDSLLVPGVVIATFESATIAPGYYCEHPWSWDTAFAKITTGPSFITPTN